MHYRDGREAKNGDRVIQISVTGGEIVGLGVLHSASPGNDYCNGKIAPIPFDTTACICDCLHVESLAKALAVCGLDKRPEGK
jgi:hypothetical protein